MTRTPGGPDPNAVIPGGASRSLARRSEALAHRGLDLAETLTTPEYRILHFPPDRCVGTLYARSEPLLWFDPGEWPLLGEARGEVKLPIGAYVALSHATIDESSLSLLGPTDLYLLKADLIHSNGFANIVRQRALRSLNLSWTKVTNEHLAPLGGLTGLQCVSLAGTKVSGQLQQFEQLSSLLMLDLSDTRVTDRALANVANFERLISLSLAGTKISDSGLVHLANLAHLRSLDLSGTLVTDPGIVTLSRFVGLGLLDLSATAVSRSSLEQLRMTLPQCVIIGGDVRSDADGFISKNMIDKR